MARSNGLQDNKASLTTRVIFWMTKRHLKRVPTGMRIRALDPKLLRAGMKMDLYTSSQHVLPLTIKELAQLKVAMMVGCPF